MHKNIERSAPGCENESISLAFVLVPAMIALIFNVVVVAYTIASF